MLDRVEADQSQCAFKIGEALFSGRIRAKSKSAPFGDWMDRSSGSVPKR
jgi:hypothetical protein